MMPKIKYYQITDNAENTETYQWLTDDGVASHRRLGFNVIEVNPTTRKPVDSTDITCDFCFDVSKQQDVVSTECKFITKNIRNGRYQSKPYALNFCPVCGREM